MSTFQKIQNATCIVVKGGVYSQREVYTYRGEVYVKHGSGFVGLRATRANISTTQEKSSREMRVTGTTVPNLNVLEIDTGVVKLEMGKTGRVFLEGEAPK